MSDTKWHVEIDWKNFEKNQEFLVILLKYDRKIPVEKQSFYKWKGCSNFPKVSKRFKKMVNSLRLILLTYSENALLVQYDI